MIKIVVDDADVRVLLGRIAGRVQNMSPIMRVIAGDLHDEVEENFEKEGRPSKWQDLAESTKKQRAKKGKWPGKILQVSAGGLASSVTPGSNAKSAWASSNKIYSAIQHLGGFAGRGHKAFIPPRPFMVLTDAGLEKIKDKLGKYAIEGTT